MEYAWLIGLTAGLMSGLTVGGINYLIERYKASEARAAAEHAVKFRRIDERVTETILKCYQLLEKDYRGVKDLLFEWGKTDTAEGARKILNDVVATLEFLRQNRPYIPRIVYSRCFELLNKVHGAATYMERPPDTSKEDRYGSRGMEWRVVFQHVTEDFREVLEQLVDDIKGRLGVDVD